MHEIWVNATFSEEPHNAWKNFCDAHILSMRSELPDYNAEIVTSSGFDFILQFDSREDFMLFMLKWGGV